MKGCLLSIVIIVALGLACGANALAQTAASQPAASQPATSQPATSQPILPSWAPKLQVKVQPAIAHLGDPIEVQMTVRHQRGLSVNLPLKIDLGKFTELSRRELTKDLGEKGKLGDLERTFILAVAVYELGEQTLPPIELTVVGPGQEILSLPSEAIPIKIVSVLANEPQPKLKDIEPPVKVTQKTYWLIYALAGLGLLALGGLITWLVLRQMRKRKPRRKPLPPPIPAHERALQKIGALPVEEMIATLKFKELYLQLSEIMREYVGGRWKFEALEMTTTEIVAAMHKYGVEVSARQKLKVFFTDCDLVKFAKYQPEAEHARQAVSEATGIVNLTKIVETNNDLAGSKKA